MDIMSKATPKLGVVISCTAIILLSGAQNAAANGCLTLTPVIGPPRVGKIRPETFGRSWPFARRRKAEASAVSCQSYGAARWRTPGTTFIWS